MGYTHYYYYKQSLLPIDGEKWNKLVEYTKSLIRAAEAKGITIRGWAGTDAPVITSDEISFNGTVKNDKCHDTFMLLRVGPSKQFFDKEDEIFAFCKTARKPYDLVVMAVLIAAKHVLGNVLRLLSDGGNEEWSEGADFCQKVLGFGGDFLILPESPDRKD